MPWIIGGAILGGALLGSAGAKSAATKQAAGTAGAAAEQARQYDVTREDFRPYREAGALSLADLLRRSGFGGGAGSEDAELMRRFSIADFMDDPVTQLSFQSGLDEGRRGLERIAPLSTGRDSGAMLKELTRFGTDYAGQRAGESYNRFVADQGNVFNRLAALAGIGQSSTARTASIGMDASRNISNLLSAQGNAQAASRIAQANIQSGALQSVANWWQQNQSNQRQQGMWNDMMSLF